MFVNEETAYLVFSGRPSQTMLTHEIKCTLKKERFIRYEPNEELRMNAHKVAWPGGTLSNGMSNEQVEERTHLNT